MFRNIFICLVFGCFSIAGFAQSKIVEEIITVPVSVQNTYGNTHTHNVVVTLFREASRNQSPYIILNHGRSGSASERAKLGRARYSALSKYFVELGFIVIVPTRGGYGVTAGEDSEFSGGCSFPNYPAVFKAATDTSIAIMHRLKDNPYIDFGKGIAVGQSFGGATSVSLSTQDIPGLKASFNFAGGSGGDPVKRIASPCRPDLLEKLYAGYGAKSKVPTYWLYSVNDKYWGEKLPKDWFDAFIRAGGKGKFFSLPPYKEDGHSSFTGNSDAWKPIFKETLQSLSLIE